MGAPQGVTVGATVVNLIIKDVEKGLNGKMAKFATGAVLFRVTKVTAVEGPRWFEWLGHQLADEIQCRRV